MKLIFFKIKSLLSEEEFLFKWSTALKFVLLSSFFAALSFASSFMLLKMDLIFFEANGSLAGPVNRSAFYEFVYLNLVDKIPLMLVIFFIIFISGLYVAKIMMRPFKTIGLYCEQRLKGDPHYYYDPDYFSDLKLLTSFTSYFFQKIEEAKIKGELNKVDIPEEFTRIHRPILEKSFFINYFFVIVILGLLASVSLFILHNEVREQIITAAPRLIKMSPMAKHFVDAQFEVADIGIVALLLGHLLITILFGFHLYEKVSAPSFAIFATLRSFLKGNYHNRVHLIGHYYLREDCRKINKYLDTIQRDLVKRK